MALNYVKDCSVSYAQDCYDIGDVRRISRQLNDYKRDLAATTEKSCRKIDIARKNMETYRKIECLLMSTEVNLQKQLQKQNNCLDSLSRQFSQLQCMKTSDQDEQSGKLSKIIAENHNSVKQIQREWNIIRPLTDSIRNKYCRIAKLLQVNGCGYLVMFDSDGEADCEDDGDAVTDDDTRENILSDATNRSVSGRTSEYKTHKDKTDKKNQYKKLKLKKADVVHLDSVKKKRTNSKRDKSRDFENKRSQKSNEMLKKRIKSIEASDKKKKKQGSGMT